MSELVFEVMQEADGGFVAEALGEDIFTQGDTWEELKANIQDAVKSFYFDSETPSFVRLHLRKDEVLAVA
jgi:predicted RNase H-like HicB family nuclease